MAIFNIFMNILSAIVVVGLIFGIILEKREFVKNKYFNFKKYMLYIYTEYIKKSSGNIKLGR